MYSQLKTHDWPGNIQELQNIIARAVVLSEGGSRTLAGADRIGRHDGAATRLGFVAHHTDLQDAKT